MVIDRSDVNTRIINPITRKLKNGSKCPVPGYSILDGGITRADVATRHENRRGNKP